MASRLRSHLPYQKCCHWLYLAGFPNDNKKYHRPSKRDIFQQTTLPMSSDVASGGRRLTLMPKGNKWRTIRTIIHRVRTEPGANWWLDVDTAYGEVLWTDSKVVAAVVPVVAIVLFSRLFLDRQGRRLGGIRLVAPVGKWCRVYRSTRKREVAG